jgi:hypothetical protein
MCIKNDWITSADGTPLLKTSYRDRLYWLMQPNQGEIAKYISQKQLEWQESLESDLVFATKASEREPKSAGTIEKWHRRLGYIG